jgi:hypothetical protein
MPSCIPTELPTHPPTSLTVTTNSSSRHKGWSLGGKIAVGVIVGLLGMASLLGGSYYYALTIENNFISRTAMNDLLVRCYATLACCFSIVIIGLVSAWAHTPSSSSSTINTIGYLGKPTWKDSKPYGYLSWHPILMIAGFMFSQFIAVAAWVLIPNHTHAKLIHVLFQTAGLTTCIAGWYAIAEYKKIINQPTFTTMHSLIGFFAVVVFGMNYIWGCTMAFLTVYYPKSLVRKHINLVHHHRKLGGFAMIMSVAAVLTGIMNQLPQGTCYYIVKDNDESAEFDVDSADQYHRIPQACKLALGLGICVIFALIFTLAAAFDRDHHNTTTANTTSVDENAVAKSKAGIEMVNSPNAASSSSPSSPDGYGLVSVNDGGDTSHAQNC